MSRYVAASFVGVALCLVPFSTAEGGIFQKNAAQKAAVQKAPMPVVQKTPIVVAQKSMPVVAQKSFVTKNCCPPKIRYVQRRRCKCVCCGCTQPVQTILQVRDPRGCGPCSVSVPVCLPGCCVGMPAVRTGVGLLGRGNVVYRWCCGYRVKIVFDKCGDITVNHFGS